ncbi:hypothetical protein [Archangium primigenium]|uniref:hypothetical protein n=1 Tax=[Archangium] primigenium TaxID=2792470 RepID=UPI001EF896CA|nr:hypothetical protein [Archangium primigenium]
MSLAPALLALGGLLLAAPTSPDAAREPPPVSRLRVTQGRLEPLSGGRQRIEEPKVRAVDATGREGLRVAELRLTYLGPSARQRALLSGEQRRQVGLKLRARDGCNVVYVMWRLAPVAGLVVSVKSNPGQSRSDDCDNHGYLTVKPEHRETVPELQTGVAHTLRAELRGTRLRVCVDGVRVWEGPLPAEAFAFDGPVGLRSDNGRFDVQLRATP